MARTERFAAYDLSSVRFVLAGGEAMPESLIEAWHERGIAVRQGYGLTEFGPNVFSLDEADARAKLGSIGQPNFYVNARILTDDGDILSGEGEGELLLHGPVMTPGYWRKPEETASLIRRGWLHTGDVVRRDRDGFYYVVGRKKEMYISGGENVFPAEVERVLPPMPG